MAAHRAIVLYLGAIVLPVGGLVWLGLQSFERQRQALSALRAQTLAKELAMREHAAAEVALSKRKGPIAKHFFRVQNGVVIEPRLSSPLPLQPPEEYREARRLEDLKQYGRALAEYQRLRHGGHSALALQGVARSLANLGRETESRAAWKLLAAQYPDQRDLAHRPFGIVAALAAGETVDLYDKIESGRWDLTGEQAEYFLSELEPQRRSKYLDRFRFARELNEEFRPSGVPQETLNTYQLLDSRVFYRAATDGSTEGLAVDEDWILHELRPQVEKELGGADPGQEMAVYVGASALVFLFLSTGIAMLIRDVRREARTNLLRADFVSGVSHELKTPITLIRLYADTLLDRPELRESEQKTFYGIIARESERLTRLVNQILMFSRVERGAEHYNLSAGDLSPTISEALDHYTEHLQHAGFTLKRNIGAPSLPVRFDAAAVSQAVSNLLDNAVKYSGESREIVVKLEGQDRMVVLEVEDHGLGIPAVHQEKIFERFYRVANGSGKGGYGLGLFLVRHIMRAHGGRVEVESETGRGSRFRLMFPIETV